MITGKPATNFRQSLLTVGLAALFTLACTLVAVSASSLDQAVLQEMNAARTDPHGYTAHLQRHLTLFEGKRYRPPGVDYWVATREGPAAVNEAIAFLRQQRPLPPLAWEAGLARSAAELVRAQAQSGQTGHGAGTLAMKARIGRQVKWTGSIGENIAYGPKSARDIVLQLIVDDGVPGRGHRTNIFSSGFRLAGVACGAHPTFRTVCVIDFAGGTTK